MRAHKRASGCICKQLHLRFRKAFLPWCIIFVIGSQLWQEKTIYGACDKVQILKGGNRAITEKNLGNYVSTFINEKSFSGNLSHFRPTYMRCSQDYIQFLQQDTDLPCSPWQPHDRWVDISTVWMLFPISTIPQAWPSHGSYICLANHNFGSECDLEMIRQVRLSKKEEIQWWDTT